MMGCALLYSPVQCWIDWNRCFCQTLILPEGIPRGNISENSYGSAWEGVSMRYTETEMQGALQILVILHMERSVNDFN